MELEQTAAQIADVPTTQLPSPAAISLGPSLPATCAVVCAALAARADWPTALWGLLGAWLLADPLLSAYGLALRWLHRRPQFATEGPTRPRARLPYAQPGSRAWHWAEQWARFSSPDPELAGQPLWRRITTPLVLAGLMLVLATYLGRWPLTLTAGALVAGIALTWPWPQAQAREHTVGIQVAYGWSLAALLSGELDLRTGLAAFCLGLLYAASADARLWARIVSGIAWLALVIGAIVSRQPLAAGLIAAVGVLTQLDRSRTGPPALSRLPYLAALALAALTLAAQG